MADTHLSQLSIHPHPHHASLHQQGYPAANVMRLRDASTMPNQIAVTCMLSESLMPLEDSQATKIENNARTPR